MITVVIIIIIIPIIRFQRTTNTGMVEEDEHPITTKYPRGRCATYSL